MAFIGQFEIKICDKHNAPFIYCAVKPDIEIKYQCLKCVIEKSKK
jgi:hypothetical protein